jgi:hypothetical protein
VQGRLLIDEMFPRQAAEALRQLGHDAVSAHDVCPSAPDAAMWELAVAQGRAIVTENMADFRPLLTAAVREGTPAVPVLGALHRRLPRGGALASALARRIHEFLAQRDELPVTEWWP